MTYPLAFSDNVLSAIEKHTKSVNQMVLKKSQRMTGTFKERNRPTRVVEMTSFWMVFA